MISKAKIESRLRPWAQAVLDEDQYGMLTPEHLLELFNEACEDLNSHGQVRIERFLKKTGSDLAEDSNKTNYLLNGVIERIISFKYSTSGYETQEYSYISDRLILKTGSEGVEMDITYLRKTEKIEADSDEIDLPEEIIPEYLALLRVKIMDEMGISAPDAYQDALMAYKEKVQHKLQRPLWKPGEVKRSWMGQSGDDHYGLIKDNYIGIENFTLDVSGNYTYVSA